MGDTESGRVSAPGVELELAASALATSPDCEHSDVTRPVATLRSYGRAAPGLPRERKRRRCPRAPVDSSSPEHSRNSEQQPGDHLRLRDGLWLRRALVAMGSGYDGLWLRWALVSMGSGYDGLWLRWALVTMGSGYDGLWLRRALVAMGSGCDGLWLRRALVATGSGCDVPPAIAHFAWARATADVPLFAQGRAVLHAQKKAS
jgi:hypothetical protein